MSVFVTLHGNGFFVVLNNDDDNESNDNNNDNNNNVNNNDLTGFKPYKKGVFFTLDFTGSFFEGFIC